MPVEGHAQRMITPLSRRDRRVLGIAAALTAITVAVAGTVYATRPAGSSSAGCVVANLASTMGGVQVKNCGAAAHTFCRIQGKVDPVAAAACRREGFAADVPVAAP
jgi:hypothetical protein